MVMAVMWRRLSVEQALIWSILGGYLLLPPLPVGFNLPVVPDLNKNSIPALTALAIMLFSRREKLNVLPDSLIGRGLILIFVMSPFATVLTNGEELPKGANDTIQGMRIYDSVAAVTNQMIDVLPFFLARHYLAGPEAMRLLVAALVLAGLGYSVPMLLETQIAPVINIWVYGFFQHDFFQMIRAGGYRPIVFLPHGLWVAFFALMAAMAALVTFRVGPAPERPKQALILVYLLMVLVACKSAGPMIFALALTPLILFAPRRVQILVAAGLAVIVMTYPLLRGAHLIPVDRIIATAFQFSPDRAWSFQFRVMNEERLLDWAQLKPFFGWGGYGRNLLYDPESGITLTIVDGAWILVLGVYGWAGYIAQFGLLVLPLVLMGREMLAPQREAPSPFLAAICLILAANLLDLLPNGTLVPLTWLMAGAVLGQAERMRRMRVLQRATDLQATLHPRNRKTVI